MQQTDSVMDVLRDASLRYIREPSLWGLWPFLPLVRRRRGCMPEEGVLYDARCHAGLAEFTTTVFLTNVFMLPGTLKQLLALPQQVFAAPEAIVDAGWRVD